MGLLEDIFAWLKQQLINIISWIAEQVNAITIWLKLQFYKFKQWLSDFMSTTWGFWVVIVVGITLIVALSVVMIKIGAFFESEAWIKFTTGVKTFLSAIGADYVVMTLKISHSVLMALDDAYKTAYRAMLDSLSGLALTIDVGVGDLNAFMGMFRQFYKTIYTITGLHPIVAEQQFWEKYDLWIGGLEAKMEEYVQYPNNIFSDMFEFFMNDPDNDLAKTTEGLAGDIADLDERLIDSVEAFDDLLGSYTTFYESFPEEMQKGYLAAVNDAVYQARTYIDETIMPVMDEILSTTRDLQQEIHDIRMKLWQEKHKNQMPEAKSILEKVKKWTLQELVDLIKYEQANKALLKDMRNG